MRRGVAVIFAIAVSMALPQTAFSAKGSDFIAFPVELVVNESLPGFAVPQRTITIPQGTTKFTSSVPKSATGRHGIGIDGGPYKNILGASVRPGSSSALTVGLPPGDYTVFDSYKKNRSAGFYVKVHVTHAKPKHVSYGTLCRERDVFDSSRLWVKDMSCSAADVLLDEAYDLWRRNDLVYTPVTVREFTCYYTPFSAVGTKASCLSAGARATYSG